MCIIIDTNTLDKVFNNLNAEYSDFSPVFNWLYNGKGKIVYGGSRYFEELKKAQKYLRIFIEFRKQGKAVYIDNAEVDTKTAEISKTLNHRNFDDQHIVALLIVSKCKLICSSDKKAHPYFTHLNFFTSRNRPKIFSGKTNSNLLSDVNIATCCAPSHKMTNKIRKVLPRIN